VDTESAAGRWREATEKDGDFIWDLLTPNCLRTRKQAKGMGREFFFWREATEKDGVSCVDSGRMLVPESDGT